MAQPSLPASTTQELNFSRADPRDARGKNETQQHQAAVGELEQLSEKYLEIEARSFADERDIRRVLECLGALVFDDSQLKTDALDDAACFKQNLTDWKIFLVILTNRVGSTPRGRCLQNCVMSSGAARLPVTVAMTLSFQLAENGSRCRSLSSRSFPGPIGKDLPENDGRAPAVHRLEHLTDRRLMEALRERTSQG